MEASIENSGCRRSNKKNRLVSINRVWLNKKQRTKNKNQTKAKQNKIKEKSSISCPLQMHREWLCAHITNIFQKNSKRMRWEILHANIAMNERNYL